MFATQNWSRCSRHTSRSICRHSRRGSTDRRMRARSIQPVLRDGSSDAGALLAFRARVRANGAQALAVAHDQRHVIGGEREAVGALEQRFGAQRGEVEQFQAAGRLLVAAAAVRAGNRERRPQHLAGGAGDLAEAALRPPETRRPAARCRRDRRGPRAASRPTWSLLAPVLGGLQSPWVPDRTAAAGRSAARSGRDAPRAENSTRIARCRRPGRTCAPTGSRGTCPRDRTPANSRGTRAAVTSVLVFFATSCSLIAQGRGLGPERVGEPRAVRRPGEVLAASGVAAVDDRQPSSWPDRRSALRCDGW